jgi:hypothetical protein
MNDLDVILASVEELQAYLQNRRKCGRAACVRRIRRLRKDLDAVLVPDILSRFYGTGWMVHKK